MRSRNFRRGLDIGSHINAQAEARATRYKPTLAKKRTLWPVASSASLGLDSANQTQQGEECESAPPVFLY
jgi:hypothetical protein